MLKNMSKVPGVEWAPSHFSWTLVDYENICVKIEEIPPEGKSEIHFHTKSFQFFLILNGEATFKLEDRTLVLRKHDGIEIPSKKRHQILNPGKKNLQFLIISSPRVQEDDIFN